MALIPKIIHYCWFGGSPLTAQARKCMASWKKYFPDYEIREWNERNFNVNLLPYTRDAYAARKYAFVSDVARFWILVREGGLYFDTDVEVISPMNDLVSRGAFMGWETASATGLRSINPGLGLGCEAGNAVFADILDRFGRMQFAAADGGLHPYTMIPMVCDVLRESGMRQDGTLQTVRGVTLYPADYFCPMDALTGRITLTANTRSIHRYSMSWMSPAHQFRVAVMRRIRRWAGSLLPRCGAGKKQ